MGSIDLLGLLVLGLFLVLLFIFLGIGERRGGLFRSIPGYEALDRAIERAVEAGERVHLSLGTGSLIGTDSAPALAGLAILGYIARMTTLSDKPMVVSTGDGAMAILAQDSLRSVYRAAGALDRFGPNRARMLGPTPYSYVASLPILIASEDVSAHVLAGSFGSEGALAADFGERAGIFVLAGTDDAQSQALLYATASYPLIGEEVFAGGAYLQKDPSHRASLRVQDAVRFILIGGILLGGLLRLLGIGV
ncbi:MAG: DUF6754 domain-containing protein [Anaerolineales bacterium]|jgi:hypothetical protein